MFTPIRVKLFSFSFFPFFSAPRNALARIQANFTLCTNSNEFFEDLILTVPPIERETLLNNFLLRSLQKFS